MKLKTNALLRIFGFQLTKYDKTGHGYRDIMEVFFKDNIENLRGDILEIGANGWNVKHLLKDLSQYKTLDTRPGKDVDIVGDVMDLSKYIGTKKFDTIVCIETLEHVKNPRKAVDEIFDCLKEGGTLFASTPFFYELHGEDYGDYWRITRQGWKELLRNFNEVNIKPVGLYELRPHHYLVIAMK